MRKSQKGKLVTVLLVVALILFGFVQEYVKVATNHYLSVGDEIAQFYEKAPDERKEAMIDHGKVMSYTGDNYVGLSILHQFGRKAISISKWVLTFFFIVVHLVIIVIVIRRWFDTPQFTKPIVILYLIAMAIAIVSFALGKVGGQGDAGYGLARKILGGLQSVVPLMIIFPACLLYLHQSKSADHESP